MINTTTHVLLAEDESALATLLKECLKEHGYHCKLAKDGEEAWELFQVEKFDICILDVNMPKKTGFELAKLIRQRNANIPIVFLTANATEEDKLKGFSLGGDEYITKPFSMNELAARLNAILRRSTSNSEVKIKDEIYEVADIKIDFLNHLILSSEGERKISGTEAQLLKLFATNQNQLIPRNTLLLEVWGRDDFYTARNLDVYINKIRKLLKPFNNIEIINVHGSGFKMAIS